MCVAVSIQGVNFGMCIADITQDVSCKFISKQTINLSNGFNNIFVLQQPLYLCSNIKSKPTPTYPQYSVCVLLIEKNIEKKK